MTIVAINRKIQKFKVRPVLRDTIHWIHTMSLV